MRLERLIVKGDVMDKFEFVIKVNLIGSFNMLRLSAAAIARLNRSTMTARAVLSSIWPRLPLSMVRSVKPPREGGIVE